MNRLPIHWEFVTAVPQSFQPDSFQKEYVNPPQEPTNFYKPSYGDLTLLSWGHYIYGEIFFSRTLGMYCYCATAGAGIMQRRHSNLCSKVRHVTFKMLQRKWWRTGISALEDKKMNRSKPQRTNGPKNKVMQNNNKPNI